MLQTKYKEQLNSNEEFNSVNTNNLNNNHNPNANSNNNINNNEINNYPQEGNIFDNHTEVQSDGTRVQNVRYNYMVMDSLLLRTHDDNPNLNNFKNNNGKALNRNNLNIENDPRILTFTSKNKGGNNQNTLNYINRMKTLKENNDLVSRNNKILTERILSKTPERILDAPNLIDDYYLNLLDWSKDNVVAVGLGNWDLNCLLD